jgi:hypothetical protein
MLAEAKAQVNGTSRGLFQYRNRSSGQVNPTWGRNFL